MNETDIRIAENKFHRDTIAKELKNLSLDDPYYELLRDLGTSIMQQFEARIKDLQEGLWVENSNKET